MTHGRLVIFLAGLLLLAGLAAWAGMDAVLKSLAALGARGFLLVTLVHVPVIALLGLAWWCMGRGMAGMTPLRFIGARLVRDSVAEVLPFSQIGGFLAGLRLIDRMGADALAGGFSMFADLVTEFTAKLFYALMGVAALAALSPGARLAGPLLFVLLPAIACIGLAFAFRTRLRSLAGRAALRLVRRWMPQRAAAATADPGRFFAFRRTLPGFAIHLACWLIGAGEAWLTLRLMGMPVSPSEALAIDALGTTLRTFGFAVPGAAGVQEAGYALVCALFGIGPAEAVAFSVARRARDLTIGLPGIALWQYLEARGCRRGVIAADAPEAAPPAH